MNILNLTKIDSNRGIMMSKDTIISVKSSLSQNEYKINITQLSKRLELPDSLKPENPFCSIFCICEEKSWELPNFNTDLLENISNFSFYRDVNGYCKTRNFLDNPETNHNINFSKEYKDQLKAWDLEIIHIIGYGKIPTTPIIYAGRYGFEIGLSYYNNFEINLIKNPKKIDILLHSLSHQEVNANIESLFDIVDYDAGKLPLSFFDRLSNIEEGTVIMSKKKNLIGYYNSLKLLGKSGHFSLKLNTQQLSQLILECISNPNSELELRLLVADFITSTIVDLSPELFQICLEYSDTERILILSQKRQYFYCDLENILRKCKLSLDIEDILQKCNLYIQGLQTPKSKRLLDISNNFQDIILYSNVYADYKKYKYLY